MITPDDIKASALVGGFPSKLRVARVPLADPASYRALLHADEWHAASAYDGRRRQEHVAGQLAARIALEALVGEAAHHAVIARDRDGAPEVRGLPPLVSISHGRRFAVAVVGQVRALGIDLCEHEQSARVRRVAERFISAEENALAAADDWATLWALKEAAAKALRRGLLEGGLRASCVASLEPPRFAWPALEAVLARSDDDVVAVVYSP